MARLGRDTAKRSLAGLLDKLHPQSTVEIVNHPGPPADGTAARVKVEIALAELDDEGNPIEVKTTPPEATGTKADTGKTVKAGGSAKGGSSKGKESK